MRQQKKQEMHRWRARIRNHAGRAMLLPVLLLSVSLTGCLQATSGGNLTQAGLKALEKNDYQTAMADFSRALESGEPLVPALRGQGIAYMGLARYDDAAASFGKALEEADNRMPKTVRDITLYHISALFRAGHHDEVITACSALLEQEEVTEACFYMGAAYLQMGDAQESRTFFDRAVASAPDDYSLYLKIYEQYENRNLTAIGDEYLQQALRLQPDSAQDYYRIAQMQFYLEKYEDARLSLQKPVEENYLPALELMGQIYMAMGDYDHARASYQSIIDQSGEKPILINGLVMCSIAAGKYDEALAQIEKGLALEEEEGKQQLRFNEIVAWEGKLDFATALVKAEAYHALYPTDELGTKELQFLNTRGK